MSSNGHHTTRSGESNPLPDLGQFTIDELKQLKSDIESAIAQQEKDTNLESANEAELVNGQFVQWSSLSAHANLKAVKPWIRKVTGLHEKFGVDGDWLEKQKIDGRYHMDVSDLHSGDVIKVSGASHTNKKHRYYRVLAIADSSLYYERVKEAEVIEIVG